MNGVKTGIRTIAGYLTIRAPVCDTLHLNVKTREATANTSGGRMMSEMKQVQALAKPIPPVSDTFRNTIVNDNPLAQRLNRLAKKHRYRLSWVKEEFGGTIFKGPTLKKVVNPFEALMTDVTKVISSPRLSKYPYPFP